MIGYRWGVEIDECGRGRRRVLFEENPMQQVLSRYRSRERWRGIRGLRSVYLLMQWKENRNNTLGIRRNEMMIYKEKGYGYKMRKRMPRTIGLKSTKSAWNGYLDDSRQTGAATSRTWN